MLALRSWQAHGLHTGLLSFGLVQSACSQMISPLAPVVHRIGCAQLPLAMLRIGLKEDSMELKIVLEGELVEPWAAELKSIWEAECRAIQRRRCTVDLADVTRVDESGKNILAAMKRKGAELSAHGVFMKHLIRGLRKRDLS